MKSYSKVLVTGANSFFAAAIMSRLVDLGIHINGTVRNERSAEQLKKRYGEMIDVFLTPDISIPGAFQAAIEDCEVVFHVASPFRPQFTDPVTEFLDPAIQGTVNLLQTATNVRSVKRVIMTSSVAAIIDPTHEQGFFRPGYTYTEEDWNPVTYEQAARSDSFSIVYTASKALAEKAAWGFMQQSPRHFDFVAINPCQTWGNFSEDLRLHDAMNFSNSDLSRLMDGEEKDVPQCMMPWVTDIENVADAHIAALLNPAASGRYIIAATVMDFQAVVDLMHDRFAEAEWIRNVPRGKPGTRQVDSLFRLDNSKSQRELGLIYRPIQDTVVSFCQQYQQYRGMSSKL